MKNTTCKWLLAGILASLAGMASVQAGTESSQFTAQIAIEADCTVSTPDPLDFGTTGLLTSNVDAQTSFTVTCTNGTYHVIMMSDGQHAWSSQNRMANNGQYVKYELFSDAARTQVWDFSHYPTAYGTGAAQSYTVYGRVPPQTTPAPGTYTDTVTIWVYY